MKADFNYTAWILQLVFGAVIGFFIGVALAMGPRYSFGLWIYSPSAFIFSVGVSLIVAGLAGKYGDKLWCNQYYSIIETGFLNNHITRVLNYIVIAGGTGLVAMALYLYFNYQQHNVKHNIRSSTPTSYIMKNGKLIPCTLSEL